MKVIEIYIIVLFIIYKYNADVVTRRHIILDGLPDSGDLYKMCY